MTKITFTDGNNLYQLVLEVLEDADCRVVIFKRDEDTGARSVLNIIQCEDKNLAYLLQNLAEFYDVNILTDLRLPFDPDLGRATTLKGWCKKIQIHVEAGRIIDANRPPS